MSSSPRYMGYFSPDYPVQLTDDSGKAINLTGVDVNTGFTLIMQNTNTLQFQHGIGTWTITDATNGKASYQWTDGDLYWPGTFLVFVTVQLPGEPSPRAFDPDTVVVVALTKGNAAVATQDVNLLEVNGQIVSSANPVPISGPVTTADGGNVTLGSKADAAITDPTVSASEIALLKGLVKILALQGVAITGVSGALADGAIATLGTEADVAYSGSGNGTVVALLKKVEALLAGTLSVSSSSSTQPISAVDGAIASLGSEGDAAWSGSGNGTAIAILKKLEALLAATQTITGNVTEANSSSINTHVANIDSESASIVTNTGNTATHAASIDTAASAIKSDTDSIVTNTTGLATQATLSAAKTDLDSISTNTSNTATNTSNIETHAASIDTNTSNASTVLGTTADAAWSLSGNASIDAVAKKIALLLSGILQVEQADLSTSGTINAAQSTENTPVAGATVQLALGEGQSSWKAQLLSGGTFTSATTIVADGTPDGGTTWYSKSFKVSGANTPASSVVGPGPLELSGNASGLTHVRIRCSVLGSTETIVVTLRASAAIGDIGILSPLPAGTNVVGGVTASGNFNNASVGTDGSAIPASSTLIGASDGTNLQQLLVESASHQNLRTALYNGANELAIDSNGVIKALLEVVSGTALAADQSNTELRTSLYGKNSAAGDTALKVNSSGDQYVLGDFTEQASLSAGSLNADLVPSTDVSTYKSFGIQITGAWSGTITIQGSNDNVNFNSAVVRQASVGNSETTTIASNNLFVGDIGYRYLRIRMTSYTSGTANGTLELYTLPLRYGTAVNAGQLGTWTVQPGNTPNTTPWLVAASTSTLFTTSQSAVSSGNSGDLSVSALREISIDITTTAQAGTNPTIQFFWERKGADGNYYPLWQSNVLTAAANTLSTSIGAGMAYNQSLGPTGRLRWVVGGSASPTYTFTPNVYGK